MRVEPFSILADTHVHLYPCYDVEKFFSVAAQQFAKVAKLQALPAATKFYLFLTERADCDAFSALAALNSPVLKIAQETPTRIRVEVPGAGAASSVSIRVVAGRQVNTKERVELLALNTRASFEDRKPLEQSLEQIRSSGAFSVLNWSPGKWMFGRYRVVEQTIRSQSIDAVGDIAARPYGWGTPQLLGLANQLGIPLLFGSDPLPFSSDLSAVGRYVTHIRCGSFKENGVNVSVSECVGATGASTTASYNSLSRLFPESEFGPVVSICAAGKRDSLPRMLWRQVANELARRR